MLLAIPIRRRTPDGSIKNARRIFMARKKLFKAVASAALMLMLTVNLAYAASLDEFTLLKGGSKPDTMKVVKTDGGIAVTGQGSYTPDGEAAGVIFKNAVDPKDVTVEFTIDAIPTLNPIKGGEWSQERDSWYTVSIMDQPKFWTVSNDAVKSFTLAISPISRDRAYVHAYRTFAGGFFQMNWLETIDCKAGSKMAVNIKWVDKKVTATINGVNIPLDALNNEQLPTIDPVFGDQVYVAVAANTGAKEAAFTLSRINDVSFAASSTDTTTAVETDTKDTAAEVKTDAGQADSPADTNPKTGDAGVLVFAMAALVSGFILKKLA